MGVTINFHKENGSKLDYTKLREIEKEARLNNIPRVDSFFKTIETMLGSLGKK